MRPAINTNKREALERLLADHAEVYVRLDARVDGCRVPTALAPDPALVLRWGLNLQPPIAELSITDDALSGWLAFGGFQHFCVIPWAAIYAVQPAGLKDLGLYWPDSVPPEMKHAIPVEPKLTLAEEKAKRRARLKLVN